MNATRGLIRNSLTCKINGIKSLLDLKNDSHLTHWGRVTHICVGKLTIIGSDNGLSPGRRQAIIWTNAGILLIGPLGTKFSEILIKIYTFSFKKINLKVSSGKWRPSCLGLNELTVQWNTEIQHKNCTLRGCIPDIHSPKYGPEM